VGYAGVIENGTAFYYECYCADAGCSITNFPGANIDHTTTGWFSVTNQPALPTSDPIIVTNTAAWYASGQQVAVQWELPLTSSPQLSYRIDVFTNASYIGSPAVTFFDRDPDCRMKVVNIPGVATPYVRLTIADIFDNTNMPIAITPASITLSAATNLSGAVNGLGYKYYESATSYYWRTDGNNWTNLPNFDSLMPKRQGAVLFPDITPHLRHNAMLSTTRAILRCRPTAFTPSPLSRWPGRRSILMARWWWMPTGIKTRWKSAAGLACRQARTRST